MTHGLRIIMFLYTPVNYCIKLFSVTRSTHGHDSIHGQKKGQNLLLDTEGDLPLLVDIENRAIY
jgi:hypothetical protein